MSESTQLLIHFKDFPFGVPEQYIWSSNRLGNTTFCNAFQQLLEEASSDNALGPAFREHVQSTLCRLKGFLATLGAFPRLDSSEVPSAPVDTTVRTICDISAQMAAMESMLSKSEDICKHLAENKKALNEVLEQPLKDADEETLLRSTESDDGFKQGWRGRWWRHGRRQRADDVLARKLQRWMMAEDKDEAGDTQIELLQSLLANLRGQLAILHQMQTLTMNLQLSDGPLLQLHSNKEQLLKLLQMLIEKCETTRDALQLNYDDYLQQTQKRLKGLSGQQSQYEKELADLEAELKRLMDSSLDDLVNRDPDILRLTDELIKLRKLLAFHEAELDQARARARRRIEEQTQMDILRLQEALEKLRNGHRSLKAAQQKQRQEDEERQRALAEDLQRAEDIIATLHRSADACTNTMSYVKIQQDFILQCGRSISRIQAEIHSNRRPQVPAIRSRMLEVAVELYELLTFLCREKEQRVSSIENTMESRTMLLEFCVDTQDPNAHKHEQIIGELTVMREQLKRDVDGHQNLLTQLVQQCRIVVGDELGIPDPYYDESVRSLRERAPQFFNLIEGRSLNKAVVPSIKASPSPNVASKYVASKRLAKAPTPADSPIVSPAAADMRLFRFDPTDLPLDELLNSPEIAEMTKSPVIHTRLKALTSPMSPAASPVNSPAAADADPDAETPQVARRRRMNTKALSPAAPIHFHREEFCTTGMLP